MFIESMFKNVVENPAFFQKVFPHLKPEYFLEDKEKFLLKYMLKYASQYSKAPTYDDIKLIIETDDRQDEDEGTEERIFNYIDEIKNVQIDIDTENLVAETEKWCQQRSLEIAILKAVNIIENPKENKSQIVELVRDALNVEFELKIGHDYFKDCMERFDTYTKKETKFPLNIELLNAAFGGGLERKTIFILLGKPNIGKTLWAGHCAASLIQSGQDVLYVTGEMAEEKIAMRVDANLLDISMDDLNPTLDKEFFKSKIKGLYKKTRGKLIIKEYGNGTSTALNVRMLLNELKTKKKFIPKFIILDYLGCFASSRLPHAAAMNSYQYMKAVVEEFRALAMETGTCILTMHQVNREGSKAGTDTGMDNVADCIFVDEEITLRDGTVKKIGDVKLGDQLTSNDSYKTVLMVHHKKIKKCFKIKTKSGKSIVVSGEHIFPTNVGRLSINDGLKIGYKLNSK